MLLLIDNYDSFTFNLAQYFGELGADVRVVRNDAITVEGIFALAPSHLVISPGPGNPDEAGVSLAAVSAIAAIADVASSIPVLGVCLGHQTIGQALGGRIVRAPRVMHGKVSDVLHDGTGVFHGLHSPIVATRYHSLVIAPESVPACLAVNARTAEGEIMGVRHRERPIHGVQFHPESIMTASGKHLLRNFLEPA